MNDNFFTERYEKRKNDPEFILEGIILELTVQICREMEKQNINRAELARRLGKSRAYVTRMLDGNTNFTLQSLVKIASALGSDIEVNIKPGETKTSEIEEEVEERFFEEVNFHEEKKKQVVHIFTENAKYKME